VLKSALNTEQEGAAQAPSAGTETPGF